MKINTFFDFCSGIGAGRLGLEQSGLRCVGYSDTSRLSVATYKQMFDTENEKNYGNLKKIKSETLPSFDLLIAGFPCQTFSVIGRKAGFNDDRGQIIFHLIRILNETRPKCFILENVRGLVSHDKGATIKKIMTEFDDIGYSVVYKVLNSLDYGVPQMRQRVYFIGFDKKSNLSADGFEWPTVEPVPGLENYLIDSNNDISEINLEKFTYYLKNPTNQGKYVPTDFLDEELLIIDTRMSDLRLYRGKVPTLRSQRDGIFYIKNHAIKELTGFEALLLQGFPVQYAEKVKDSVTNRHLLMQAGNAMTVNVIKKLGDCIIKHLKKRGGNIMSSIWEDFEIDCTEYLNRKFGDYASFKHEGGSDSTIPDIKVTTKSGNIFYIDAKHSPAQCGQFVLLPDIASSTFIYSRLNTTPINTYAKQIIEHMNAQFDEFKEAGTAGKDIVMNNGSEIFSNWIIDSYRNKGARYFITNNYTILPVERSSEYFNVSAKYRVKRSGSSHVGKSNISNVLNYIKSNGYNIESSRTDAGKLFVVSAESLHNQRFLLHGYEYMFSLRDSEYEIRKLSNTFNANVIFSIDLKSNKSGIGPDEFIQALR